MSSELDAPAPAAQPQAVTRSYSDPIVRSALHEKAMGIVMDAALAGDPQSKSNAIEALISAPRRLQPVAAAALRDGNIGVRSTAALAVGKANLRDLSASVEAMLGDPDPRVRASAIGALTELRVPVDPSPLASMLLRSPSPKVRAHAAYVLGEMGNRSALGLLREAAATRPVRMGASEAKILELQISEAMIKLGDDAQVETIRAALYPSRPEELEAAALAVQILGEVKDRGAMDNLIYLSTFMDRQGNEMPAEIRLGIAQAMAKLGDRGGEFIAREYLSDPLPPVRAQAAVALGETGSRASLADLERLMNDASAQVRLSAAVGTIRLLDRGGGRR